tara:strand:- start:503 stop:742 length:240 start_codon:yes stop_codon:yes gene_type:complete
MIFKVVLIDKTGALPSAEVTPEFLIKWLADKGVESTAIVKFHEALKIGKPIDGGTIAKILGSVVFQPFVNNTGKYHENT